MRVWREPAFWVLAVAIALCFWRPLTTETFCYRDIHLLFFPKKVLLVEAIGSGQIPLWDPFTHGGQPYLASPSNTFYYPANLLYALLPVLAAFNSVIVLHFVLCGLMAYLLSRVLDLSQPAAFVAGSVYALCGYTLSTANVMLLTMALPWIPLALAATHRFVTTRRPRYLLVACLAASLPLFAGAAELTALLFVTLFVWLAFVHHTIPIRQRVRTLLLLMVFAAGLSLAQTLPAAEMIRNSSRLTRRTYEDFAKWSLSPRRLPELIVPRFFGPTDVPDDQAYWGGPFESRFPYILSIYVGISASLLIAIGVLATPKAHPQRRIVLLLLCLAGAGVFLSLGEHLPGFRALYELPFVSNFRYPIKAMLISLLPLALLAGIGAQRIEENHLRPAAIISGAAGIVLFAMPGLYGSSDRVREGMETVFFSTRLGAASQKELMASLTHTAAFAALFAFVVLFARSRRVRVAPAIAALIFVDLAVAGLRVNLYAPRSLFAKPPLAEATERVLGTGRLYREVRVPQNYRLPEPDPAWVVWWEIQTLRAYIGTLFRIPVILHNDYDGLAPFRVRTLTSIVETMPLAERSHLLSRAGVTAAISRGEGTPALTRVSSVRDSDGRPLHLYSNGSAHSVRFASHPRYVMSDPEALTNVITAPFDANEVILQQGAGGQAGQASSPKVPSCTAEVDITSRRLNETVVEVDAACGGFLVFADTFYPGWTAQIDGKATEVLRADFAFSAIAVPVGRHVVRKVYRPKAVPIGFAGSIISLAALLIVVRRMGR